MKLEEIKDLIARLNREKIENESDRKRLKKEYDDNVALLKEKGINSKELQAEIIKREEELSRKVLESKKTLENLQLQSGGIDL